MRAVVFDFGGVLFRWQPLQLLQQLLPDLAYDEASARRAAQAIFESFTPGSDWAQFDLGRVGEAVLAERIAQRLGMPSAPVRRLIDAVPGHLQAKPPSVALLRGLKAEGYRLYYLSNMPLPYAEHLQRVNPFVGDFDDGIFSSRVGLVKPDEAIFDLAVCRFGLRPAETMFIDDHLGNVQTAQRLGWQAVRFVDAVDCARALRLLGWLADSARNG